jgi:hypothetical protein
VRPAIVRSIVRVVRPHSAAKVGMLGHASPVRLSACEASTSNTSLSVDVRRADARIAWTVPKKPIAVIGAGEGRLVLEVGGAVGVR